MLVFPSFAPYILHQNKQFWIMRANALAFFPCIISAVFQLVRANLQLKDVKYKLKPVETEFPLSSKSTQMQQALA